MRSGGTDGGHGDGMVGGVAVNATAAYDAAIPKETIHRVLRQCICCVTRLEDHPDALVIPMTATDALEELYFDNASVVVADFTHRIQPALAHGMVIFTCDTCEDAHMDATPLPLFLMACQYVLMAHAMGCELVIGLPASQMGCPGTSLSLRHALRCMLKNPDSPSQQCSARGVADLFRQMHGFLTTP